MAEDPVDPAVEIRAKCTESHHCRPLKQQLDTCNARVASTPGTKETCVEELFNLLHCVDHCAAPKIFAHLK